MARPEQIVEAYIKSVSPTAATGGLQSFLELEQYFNCRFIDIIILL